ncbi:hypothetical protein Dtox_3889 [Desulfofarcimen acetoxidans DSM 771]|uniref:Uncharacterized protein n=1 Tax=Desulfofarcimen acetoxidans (strain ATCC 49208 / DSM 771 / KCTC 5769 / VKM B-1644 / 5575) TaxID=485916 RepID=C8VXV4_DESAS|nr:hypothetical protein [Desulfofarcimen acetoxidans]ACV64583.1 hypothetical protein Dtox_3889 [Desulfofarcimen acetoxidans DSM 771]
MTITNPIHESITVKPEVTTLVNQIIKNGYYKKESNTERFTMLKSLAENICRIYNVSPVKIITQNVPLGAYACYVPSANTIKLGNTSIVSFLHELRHHLQFTGDKQKRGLNKEQDAHAWSLRVFSIAVPKMFEKDVKEDKIAALAWDDDNQKVVNRIGYSQII